MRDERLTAPVTCWISVAFLQGDDADHVLAIIEHDGEAAAMAHLHSLDHGDETTDAALSNGYVYDRIPAGSTDRTIEDTGSAYAVTYNAQYRYVSLLRRYLRESESEFESTPRAPLARQYRTRRGIADIRNATQVPATRIERHTVSL